MDTARYRGVDSVTQRDDRHVEDQAIRNGCALVERPWAAAVDMAGADRGRFLHGLVTSDVKPLEPGQGAYGFISNVKGRILADLATLALEDRFLLALPTTEAEAMAAHLSKYVIVDRVEIEASDWRSLALVGPKTAEILGGLGLEDAPEEPWNHRMLEVDGHEAVVVREPDLGGLHFGLWIPADGVDGWRARLVDADAVLIGHGAYDRSRVAAGRPAFGLDFDADNFPKETGLGDEAVSYTKGCYLGQEVIARIHYRGGVNRRLCGLQLEGIEPSEALGRHVLLDGKASGTVTSAADVDGRALGLSIVHKRVEPDTEVELEGGGRARVVTLPF